MATLLTTVFLMFLIAQLMRNTMTFALVCVGQKRSPRKNPTERFVNKILHGKIKAEPTPFTSS